MTVRCTVLYCWSQRKPETIQSKCAHDECKVNWSSSLIRGSTSRREKGIRENRRKLLLSWKIVRLRCTVRVVNNLKILHSKQCPSSCYCMNSIALESSHTATPVTSQYSLRQYYCTIGRYNGKLDCFKIVLNLTMAISPTKRLAVKFLTKHAYDIKTLEVCAVHVAITNERHWLKYIC